MGTVAMRPPIQRATPGCFGRPCPDGADDTRGVASLGGASNSYIPAQEGTRPMRMAKVVMRQFYRRADGDPRRLPWHRETPDRMLVAAANGATGRALDVGCGA